MFKKTLVAIAIALSAVGCTRIESGEVGLRVNASRQVEGTELREGSWNQTAIGDVLTFPVKDISMKIENIPATTSENTQVGDLDITVVYAIEPAAVSDFWVNTSKSYHLKDSDGDILLMFNFVRDNAYNAAMKVVRAYGAMDVANDREELQKRVASELRNNLAKLGYEGKVRIAGVNVQSLLPNKSIVDSAAALVTSKNRLAIADNEVNVAKKEAERMAALASNAGQSIAYMDAQARLEVAKAIREGKVQTIVVPSGSTPMVNIAR